MSYRICGPVCENDGCGRPLWKDGLCSPCWRLRRVTSTSSEDACRSGGSGCASTAAQPDGRDSLIVCRDLYDLPSYEPEEG